MNIKIGQEISGKVQEYKTDSVVRVAAKEVKNQGTRIDISGNLLNDNVYGSHKKSADEIMSQAKETDVELSRRYMAVLSNTMSEKDYKKAMEEGFDPSSVSAEEMVTILDHIKAAMLQSGQVVEGYNDNISGEALKDITGREISLDRIKQALQEANLPATEENVKGIENVVDIMSNVDGLSQGSLKYMVENDLKPTVENIYTARFSVGSEESVQAKGYYSDEIGGYFSKKAENIQWEELEPQIEKALEKIDSLASDKEEKLKDAKWLLEQGIPVTAEKLSILENINLVEFPVGAGKTVSVAINAISAGLPPVKADLSETRGIYTRAFEQESRLIAAGINREEARLNLSIDANIKLLKAGISIDTKPIEEAVKLLREQEDALKSQFLGTGSSEELNTKAKLFINTTAVLRELPALPLALVGNINRTSDTFTLSGAHSIGMAMQARFEEAAITYEAVGTEVRKDLGDSITKAFRNVDTILNELGMETSPENRRAIRILGYNSIAITEEEVKRVAEADSKLNDTIKALTPAKTLRLIREGINPLDMPIDELLSKLEGYEDKLGAELERYSKFLYKLEKSGEISEEEKQSYIGIYRLINQIEKSDHGMLGRVLESNGAVTFGNLLTMARSSKKSFDIKINDDFGLLNNVVISGTSISRQIATAFEANISENSNKNLEEAYISQKLNEIGEAARATDEVLSELTANRIPVSPENIQAAAEFIERPNELARRIREFAKGVNRRRGRDSFITNLEETTNNFINEMTEPAGAKLSYSELIENMKEILSEEVAGSEITELVDIKQLNLMNKQLSFALRLSGEENYHIPVMVAGEMTDINLKLVHGRETGLVSVHMDVENVGALGGLVSIRDNSMEALFTSESTEGRLLLERVAESFTQKTGNFNFERSDIKILMGNPKRAGKLSSDNADNNNETVDTARLYELAKCFIESIREEA